MHAGGSSIDAQAVMAELELVLASRGYQGVERRAWLLRYLVERVLAGAQKISESEIQSAATQGPGGFSFGGVALPVEARFLRESLRQYYARDGAGDAVRISIPARSYVPVFGSGPDGSPRRGLTWRRVGVALGALALLVALLVVTTVLWRRHEAGRESRRLSAEASRGLRAALEPGTAGDLPKIVDMFRRAAAADSGNAEAWAGLAEGLVIAGFRGAGTREDAVDEARRAATEAIRLGGGPAAAHGVLGYIKSTEDWDWNGADAEFREAIRLDPSVREVHAWYARELLITGHFDQALAEFRTAVPDPVQAAPSVAQVLCSAKRYDEGIAEARRAVEGQPNSAGAPLALGICLDAKGDYKAALEAFQLGAGRMPSSTYPLAKIAQATAQMGDRQAAEAMLSQIRTRAENGLAHDWAHIGMIYAGLGDVDQAVDCLEKAVQWHELDAVYMGVEPAYERIRSNPKFTALRKRLGLP